MLERGPSGWRQSAANTWRHQGAPATPRVSGKSAGSSPVKTYDQPQRSASVTYTGGLDERGEVAIRHGHRVDPEGIHVDAAHRPLSVGGVVSRLVSAHQVPAAWQADHALRRAGVLGPLARRLCWRGVWLESRRTIGCRQSAIGANVILAGRLAQLSPHLALARDASVEPGEQVDEWPVGTLDQSVAGEWPGRMPKI